MTISNNSGLWTPYNSGENEILLIEDDLVRGQPPWQKRIDFLNKVDLGVLVRKIIKYPAKISDVVRVDIVNGEPNSRGIKFGFDKWVELDVVEALGGLNV